MVSQKKYRIKADDRVRIVNPVIVLRVGYPKTVSDYLKEAESLFKKSLLDVIGPREADMALSKIAYGLAKRDGFGGSSRTLHTKVDELMRGAEFTVIDCKTAKTGEYFPPQGGADYWGECDYWPGGLSNMKTHRLLSGFSLFNSYNNINPMIEECNVELIRKGS